VVRPVPAHRDADLFHLRRLLKSPRVEGGCLICPSSNEYLHIIAGPTPGNW
jgi:hypothetical protein